MTAARPAPRSVLTMIALLAAALSVTGCGVSARQWAAQEHMARLVRGMSHRTPRMVHCSAVADGATCTAFGGAQSYVCELSAGGPATGDVCFWLYRSARRPRRATGG